MKFVLLIGLSTELKTEGTLSAQFAEPMETEFDYFKFVFIYFEELF